jgi:hypothetical protein
MKKNLLSTLLLFCISTAFAQQGGPDTYGYIWRDSNHPQGPAYNWIDISARPGVTQVTGLTDDNASQSYQMGFQFPYYWYSVSEFSVGSNGYIIFNNGSAASPFPTIPSQLLPNDFIAPFMSDLTFAGAGNTGQCLFWTNNTDTLIVSYLNVPFWINSNPAYTGSNSFQLILSAVDSSITFQYQAQTGSSPATTQFISIGIENITGAIGLQHSYDTYPGINYAIKFYYPSSTTFVVKDAATISSNNNLGIFLSNNGDGTLLSSNVGNVGNQTLDTIPTTMEIYNSSGNSIYAINDTAFNLAPQQNHSFFTGTYFAPVAVDKYRFRTTTHVAGDFTPGNDKKDQKICVVDTTQILIPLSFTGNIPVPVGDGISWSGGNAGVGLEFVPPFYPCYVHKMEFFIASNPQPSAMSGLIYEYHPLADNIPGTLRDSIHLNADSVTVSGWNSLLLLNPLRIDSGSVFVEWRMDGDGILLGTDSTSPVSNRAWETLGGWSPFRYGETRDPMIRIQISSQMVTQAENISVKEFAGNFFPSPSNGIVQIELDKNMAEKIVFDFYDIKGMKVETRVAAPGRNRLTFDLSSFAAGIYACKISCGNLTLNRTVVITD